MMLLFALLLAAPERVVVVAKPAEKPGLFHEVESALRSAARRFYQRNDPDVDQGNAHAAQNDPEGALQAYDRALKRLPDSPELHFDRAGEMLKLGSDHAMRAHDEALAAMQTQDPSLKSRAAFDLGLSYEAMGDPDEAIKAYEQSLALNPGDRDAKVNLELLLKKEDRKKQTPQPRQQESKEQQQQKQKQQPDKSRGDEQQKNQQQQAGQKEEKKEQKPQQGQEQQQQQQARRQEQKEQQPEQEKQVDRSEAQRLLDALRASEKNLQAWRFAKDKRKEAQRGDVEKDW